MAEQKYRLTQTTWYAAIRLHGTAIETLNVVAKLPNFDMSYIDANNIVTLRTNAGEQLCRIRVHESGYELLRS